MVGSVAVGLGLMAFPFEDARGYWRWVELCEGSAVDSLWQTDRLLSREPMLECMTAMAALAGRTRRLKFGMNVVSLALRDPVLVAKQCATIDVLSEGRLLPAFGIGSPVAPEWQALSVETAGRGRKTDEALEIVRRLWREDDVTFAGVHFRLKSASIAPKPVQRDLPMWIGGSSQAAIRRTAHFGTGWQAGPETPAEVAPIIRAIAAAARGVGRAIDDDHYGAAFPYRFGRPDDPLLMRAMDAYRERTGHDPSDYFAVGDAAAIVERIAAYIEAGAAKFIVRPVAQGVDGMLAQTRRLIDEVLPEVTRRWPHTSKKDAPQRPRGVEEKNI
jgi:probable F420-dependent oxidoreductase